MTKQYAKAWLIATLTFTAAASHAADGLTPLLGAGLTFGGDEVGDTVRYNNGDTNTLHAGGLVDFRAGVEYQTIGSPLSFQLNVAYHLDRSSAKNGDISFSRVPVEALAHWRMGQAWRLGGGLRKALSVQAKGDGVGAQYVQDQKYTSSVGLVAEGEYFFTPAFGLKVRAVSEKFKPDNGGKELSGDHIGVIAAYYFR
jgi:hypothetical protein